MHSFSVSPEVDEKKVLADFKDGMLNVHPPKSEVVKPKAIKVKVALTGHGLALK